MIESSKYNRENYPRKCFLRKHFLKKEEPGLSAYRPSKNCALEFGNVFLVESGIQEKYSYWNPECWALESEIQVKESGVPVTIGIQNPRLESSTLNRESTAWNPGSRTVLHGLTEWRYLCWIPLILFECYSVCTVYFTTYFLDTNACFKTFHMNITLSIKVYTCMSITRIH